MDIEIEKDVPVAPRRNSKGLSDALRRMNVGDSIVVDATDNCHTPARRLGIKIVIRSISQTKKRVWRIE